MQGSAGAIFGPQPSPRQPRGGSFHLSLGGREIASANLRAGSFLVESAPGYQGHIPGRYSENIHGLSVKDANEHAVAEVHALSDGLRARPPCYFWATSSGEFTGHVPERHSGTHTLDSRSKPHRFHELPASQDDPLRDPARPAGVRNSWCGSWAPPAEPHDHGHERRKRVRP